MPMTSTTKIQRLMESSAPGYDRFANELMHMLAIPVFVLDTNSRVMIWNRACERLTGVPADEIIGTDQHQRSFYDQPHPTLADLVIQNRTDEIRHLYPRHAKSHPIHTNLTAESW